MHNLGRALAAFIAVTTTGCIKLDSFNCAQSSECQNGDVPGTCEAGGLCSFPDPLCPFGKKFGDFAGDQSGQCVGDGGGTGGTSNVTTSLTTSLTTSASGTGNSGTTFEPTTDPSAGTTVDPSNATTSVTVTSVTSVTSETTLTTDPGTTTAPDTTTGSTCGEVGEACVDGACCGSCSVCQGGTCQPADAEMAAMLCGSPCLGCGGDGYCGPAPADTPCMTDCKEIVWQAVVDGTKTTCFSYAALALGSVCDGGGTCKLPTPAMCPDPVMMANSPVPIVACDSVCVQVPDVCSQGLAASEVTSSSYCAFGFETPGCKTACTADKLAVDPASCDDAGTCVHGNFNLCGPYYCDGDKNICPVKCTGDAECISGTCQDTKCQ